jgi:hypothetical protein
MEDRLKYLKEKLNENHRNYYILDLNSGNGAMMLFEGNNSSGIPYNLSKEDVELFKHLTREDATSLILRGKDLNEISSS